MEAVQIDRCVEVYRCSLDARYWGNGPSASGGILFKELGKLEDSDFLG